MKFKTKTIISLFTIALASVLLNSCNATAGMGRDMRKLGEKIEDKAYENKHY